LLWLTSETGDELVSSIWAGVDVKRGMVPLRVSALTGIVGAVTSTGIAVNATLSDPSSQSVLCVPIGARASDPEGTHKIHGALQLLNKKTADAYSEADEAFIVQCATILSHILRSYATCKADILKRLFDPSLLNMVAKFKLEYNAKVKDEMLSTILSHRPGQLLFRSFTRDAQLSRNDLQQKAAMMTVSNGIKEVHHFINTLETSWKNSVAAIAGAQKREEELALQLEKSKQETATLKHQNERDTMLTRRSSLYGLNHKNDETDSGHTTPRPPLVKAPTDKTQAPRSRQGSRQNNSPRGSIS